MTPPLATPEELVGDPELAALDILGNAAEVARRALFATYPELTCGDFFVEEPTVTPRQCLAVALISTLDAVLDSVEHYRGLVENLASRRTAPSPEDDDIF